MSAPGEPTFPRIGGRYRLEERIGAGAMGVVWRGLDELLNRPVAVKELLAALATGSHNGDTLEEARQRLQREARLAARLQHPHVISMFDVVLEDDRPWLVMEYLPSKSLAAVIVERGPLQPDEVAEVGRQVADGLAAAHAAGVVHRDVKPGNVLLAEDGRVKLSDFGVSRAVDDVQVTRTGLIAGTPAFLAPETARGREPAAASDVFALGATLYAAVEGRPPFGLDDNAYAMLHRVATGAFDPPQRAGPLTALLMRLLALEPADRPSAAQARDDLAAIAAGVAPVLGPSPSTTAVIPRGPFARRGAPPARAAGPPTMTGAPARPAPRPVRRGVPVWLIALAVLVLAGGAATALVTFDRGDVPPSAAPAPTDPAPAPTEPAPAGQSPRSSPQPVPGGAIADPAGFVEFYYGLLPEQTDEAFALLSPDAQRASNGRDAYVAFWATMDDVSVVNARAVGENAVEATIVFDRRDGPDSREPHRFVLGTDDDGQTVIVSFQRLGAAR